MNTLKTFKISKNNIEVMENVILAFIIILNLAAFNPTAFSQNKANMESCCGQCNSCTSVSGYQSPKYAHPTDFPTPVELSSFTANIDRNDVILMWTTAVEVNNSGFDVERSVCKELNGQINYDWIIIGNVKGSGTSAEPLNYLYKDMELPSGKYKYRLKQIDFNGNFTYYYLSGEIEVGIPRAYRLSQNYPNPFNPVTKIDYDLPYDSKVRIILYDVLGRELMNIVNETKQAGYHNALFNASYAAGGLSSGVYFYKISAKGNSGQEFYDTKKMVIVK